MESSLVKSLLASDPSRYRKATQSRFLFNAAKGNLRKPVLGQWLANDNLYIHSYIQGLGRMLSFLELPRPHPDGVDISSSSTHSATKLLSWIIDALVNIQREKKFFIETAGRYGIDIRLDPVNGQAGKLEGLSRFEAIFEGISPGEAVLPWLEGAVVFYATEKAYLDAWSWAKSQQGGRDGPDEDGGALRAEFIPNWTNDAFVAFVDRLGKIIDQAVANEVNLHGQDMKDQLFQRSVAQWAEVLKAEEGFWPAMA